MTGREPRRRAVYIDGLLPGGVHDVEDALREERAPSWAPSTEPILAAIRHLKCISIIVLLSDRRSASMAELHHPWTVILDLWGATRMQLNLKHRGYGLPWQRIPRD